MNKKEFQLLKTISTIVFIIPLLLVSCKDEDSTGASLVGTWKEVSYVASGCTDPDDNENSTCTSSCEQIIITESTISIGGTSISYTVSGNQLTVKFPTGDETVTFEVTESTLVVTQAPNIDNGGCNSVSTYQRI